MECTHKKEPIKCFISSKEIIWKLRDELHNIDEVIENLLKPILLGEKIESVWSENLEKYILIKKFIYQNTIWYKPCENKTIIENGVETIDKSY